MTIQIRYERGGVRVIDFLDGTGTYIDHGFFPFGNLTPAGFAAAEQAAIYHATVNKGLPVASVVPKLGATIPAHINSSDGSGNIGAPMQTTSKSTDTKK
jgi:hypothetical protein